MKAFLLAAGLGTRLRPITETIPKCLIPINDRPLLYNWLDLLDREKVTDVLINTHHLAKQIESAVEKWKGNINVMISYEPELLGSAGTIQKNRLFVRDEEDFFIIYSDNLTNASLDCLQRFHKSVDSIFTTYVYRTINPTQKGIFVIDPPSGKVMDFEEKPPLPKSDLANAGICVVNSKIFAYFPYTYPLDLAHDIMPKIVTQMYVLELHDYIRDIGTLQEYEEAQTEWIYFNKHEV